MAKTLLTLTSVALLLGGCATQSGSDSGLILMGGGDAGLRSPVHDLRIAGYTISVPDDAEISRTVRPDHEVTAGISPTAHGRDLTVYPGAIVIRIPYRTGYLTFYDPDSEGHTKTYPEASPDFGAIVLGCPREGVYNDMPATESLGSKSDGTYYKTVHYDRCGNESPAGLVGHYESASHKTRAIFDDILRSVRR